MSDRATLALDIGTRKVVGLLTTAGPKGFRIVAAERLEHTTRAMYDGQIHDVVAVANLVGRIVKKLSAKAGAPLREAAVAAAGRALRTFQGLATLERSGLTELTQEEVFALELEAVQVAQGALATALEANEQPQDYHYVGHSVMGARLDGHPIGNLVGQRGNLAEITVIATFLPRGVVDSLQAVLSRNDLEMTALTLEPIAALTVAVPQSMRHLNLVLVDIGAGTSDIAITRKGAVIAYDMVPIAGDEITEALSEAYLLDFTVGEQVKRQILAKPTVMFDDILGQKQTVASSQLQEALQPAVQRLAGAIAERVLKLNGGPPQAVLLVGGGSLSPGLPSALATELGLPENRVAVRGRDAISNVDGAQNVLAGPDAVTPIGIAVAARDKSTLGFAYVHVNDRGVRLFHPHTLTVADALLAAGISIKGLSGQVGKGLTVTVNGTLRIIRGTFGKPARILVNGQPATLESPVDHRDVVVVEPGTQGEPGQATVADVAPDAKGGLVIRVNGEQMRLKPLITVGGQPASPERALADNEAVIVRPLRTVEDVLLHLGIDDPGAATSLRYTLDGAVQTVVRPALTIQLSGAQATPETPIHDGDELTYAHVPPLAVREVAAAAFEQGGAVRVIVNGKPITLTGASMSVTKNGRQVSPEEPVEQNDVISVQQAGEPPMFAHLLAATDFAKQPPAGKMRLLMTLNGEPAEFTSALADGDRVELIWE